MAISALMAYVMCLHFNRPSDAWFTVPITIVFAVAIIWRSNVKTRDSADGKQHPDE